MVIQAELNRRDKYATCKSPVCEADAVSPRLMQQRQQLQDIVGMDTSILEDQRDQPA